MMEEKIWLAHYGVKGMHWGVRKTPEYTPKTVFVSGSSKTQTKGSPYYRRHIPYGVRKELDSHMKFGDKIIVGDAPGVDRQTQDYLKKKHYKNVEVYSPGDKPRYLANKKWKNVLVDSSEFKEGSPEWLAKKDKVMSKVADKGITVILDEGSKATRNNIDRLISKNKKVSIYQLDKRGWRKDIRVNPDRKSNSDMVKDVGGKRMARKYDKYLDAASKGKDVKLSPMVWAGYGLMNAIVKGAEIKEKHDKKKKQRRKQKR